jgi:hypothetical protein
MGVSDEVIINPIVPPGEEGITGRNEDVVEIEEGIIVPGHGILWRWTVSIRKTLKENSRRSTDFSSQDISMGLYSDIPLQPTFTSKR